MSAKPKRIGIGKALRFQIFARDGFTCRYCGSQSDVVPLEVDHVIPVCQGGTNDTENLITACFPCNRGKSGKTIEQATPTEADRLRLAQERNEQMASFEAARGAAQARADLRQDICNYFCEVNGYENIQKPNLSILANMVNEHGAALVYEWIDIAAGRLPGRKERNVIMYICGIRRQFVKDQADA